MYQLLWLYVLANKLGFVELIKYYFHKSEIVYKEILPSSYAHRSIQTGIHCGMPLKLSKSNGSLKMKEQIKKEMALIDMEEAKRNR